MSEIVDRSRRPSPGRTPPPARPYRAVPLMVLGALVIAGSTLLGIGLRSPYTHSNLARGYDPGYARTAQALVGEDTMAIHGPARSARGDASARGAALYVGAGCAGCHALAGRGGVVGPRVAGLDAATVAQRVRQGPVGMPRFPAAVLSDAEVSDIAAYLRSLASD